MTKRNMPLNSEGKRNKENMEKSVQPFLLKPACKDYLWGGERLKQEFGKDYGISPLAESWECSVHPEGVSTIASGRWLGMPLDVVLKEHPELLGTHPAQTSGQGELPILVKLIDAGKDASVQVHPNDEYANIHENGSNGKAEMWYVLDADKDSKLIYGFYQDMERRSLQEALEQQCIEKYLQKVAVQKDDVFYIEPGQVHAIGKGVLLAEIQQNSNVTYRLHDYNRRDQEGKLRELHIEKALDVAKLTRSSEPRQPMRVLKYQPGCATELLCRCKYFQVERMLINVTADVNAGEIVVGKESFYVLLCLEGQGSVTLDEKLEIKKGSCVFVPADCGTLKLDGKMQLLKIRC